MGGVGCCSGGQLDRWLPRNLCVRCPSLGDSSVAPAQSVECSTALAHSSKFLHFLKLDSGPSNSGQIHPRAELHSPGTRLGPIRSFHSWQTTSVQHGCKQGCRAHIRQFKRHTQHIKRCSLITSNIYLASLSNPVPPHCAPSIQKHFFRKPFASLILRRDDNHYSLLNQLLAIISN